MMPAVTFAVVLPALLVAHNVADHWFQTHQMATTKGQRDRAGQCACARHVLTYTAVTASVVAVLWWLLDLDISPAGFVLGQLVSAVTHYWADRRYTLAWLAAALGKTPFYVLGTPRKYTVLARPHLATSSHPGDQVPLDTPTLGTGAYALDQSWHWFWLGVAAVITALV